MIKKPAIGWLALCLLLSVGCTPGLKPPTPVHIDQRPACPLTPCRLPGRPPVIGNDQWPAAVDELEAELKACAIQVIECITLQQVTAPAVSAE